MASAVLASQNESSWAHMGKMPCSNPHLNANPNPNPKKKQKQFHHATGNGVVGRYHNNNLNSPAVTQTVSDDAYSFNQTSTSRNAVNFGSYVTFNVASYTKSELHGLRKRFSAELDLIRDLQDRIESGQFSIVRDPRSQAKSKKLSGNKPPGVPFGSVKDTKSLCNGFDGQNDFMENNINFEGLLKDCKQILTKLMKHKCGWIFKSPVDAVALGLHDYHHIVRQPMDLGTVKANLAKNLYHTPVEFAADVRLTFNNALLYNPKTDPVNGMAEQMLSRFEELFRPIQEKIGCFSNQQRERKIREFGVNHEKQIGGNDELQGSSWNNHNSQILGSPPLRSKKTKPKVSPVPLSHVSKKRERMPMPMQAHSSASTASNPPPQSLNHPPLSERIPSPVVDRAPCLPVEEPKVGRAVGTIKQPKPRAKDQNKREMSMEEKQKLGIGLQSLPQEKMPQLVQIIRKRNEHLAQDGDEIELDIETLDTETLWELDRFVTNWKKMVSKTKRQALMMNNNPAAGAAPSTPIAESDMGAMDAENGELGKKLKENEDEDVDIDDDMPATNFPPVEIEKDEGAGGGVGGGNEHDHDDRGNASSSSSSSSGSSSDSSSSSDSDSGSSSGSESDADDAQS